MSAQPSIRDTLFGDLPLDQWPGGTAVPDAIPWNEFVSARDHLTAGRESDAVACWRRIIQRPDLEPRHILQAWHFLREHGQQPPPDLVKQVLGVVIEVAMPEGLDLLAAYADHSARYYNYSGAGVVWEHPDTSLDAAIDALLVAARDIVQRIGPWDQPRPAAPPADHVRLSFLTPSGLHFGQGPMQALWNDPLAGPALRLATGLMQAMVDKTSSP